MVTAILAVVAIIFFWPDDIQGNVLQQHDTMQGIANGQEGKAYHEATGETTRWTNSLFGGMPNFQIAPSYPANSLLTWIGNAYMLWLPSPANLLFAMMIGFFIMGLCFKLKWHESLFAAVAWGFSTYFIILIGAGHIWKFVTLAYIPPTIGGLALLYRRKYIAGTALTALFAALQLQSNHPQMTYYFMFVIAALVLAWLWKAVREKKVAGWCIATCCAIGAGALAVAANSASLYNSYEYSKETVRGRATELTTPGGDDTGGMDRNAITAWSYGVDETFTLLVPNVKGGATIQPVAGQNQFKSVLDTDKANELYMTPKDTQDVRNFPQYFGNQPMTNGPVYVGAFVLLLSILALFMVKSPVKWALFAVSVLAVALSWGHNFSWFTNLFIDYFPAYSKFRAVSSILVIVEFCVPLLAALCIKKMADNPEAFKRNPWVSYVIFGLGAFICFIGWVAPSVFGEPFSANEIEVMQAYGYFNNPAYYNVLNAVSETRLSLVSGDSLRSLIMIALGCAVLWLYFKGIIKNKALFVCALTVVTLIDLFPVDRRYVNSDNFTVPVENETAFEMNAADREILKDKSNYRVFDLPGNSESRSSYFHKTIGGYHAAKLTRYNDLLSHQILFQVPEADINKYGPNFQIFDSQGKYYAINTEVLNMLNAKYYLYGDQYDYNPSANGNAWFVDGIIYVPDANAEMSALDTLDTRRYAVADAKFKELLGTASTPVAGDTIYETSYAPNKLTYKASTAKGGVAVFSEVYFPWGWEITVDGKPAEMGRVNYVLRALRLSPGQHDIEFRFDPQSMKVTNTLGVIAVIIIYVLCAGAVAYWLIKLAGNKKREEEEQA